MSREKMLEEIMDLSVFDTHTHLIGDSLAAKDFWEIGHYFWFLRELQAAGYPSEPEKLSEEARINAFVDAFKATKNTSMNWVVRQIFKELYNIELCDIDSIKQAIEAVAASSQNKDWPSAVFERLNIKNVIINRPEHGNFIGIGDAGKILPRIDGQFNEWINFILTAKNQKQAGDQIVGAIDKLTEQFQQESYPGLMTGLQRFNLPTYGRTEVLSPSNSTVDEIITFLLHQICKAASNKDLFFQLFLGMENGWSSQKTANNDPDTIVRLHGLFDQYPCQFELVLASEINNMDAVQAARMFPNVYIGGMWWYNFRASTYQEAMQRRFEALPALKSSFVASDARCVEWCYGKILMVKKLMADFLSNQVEQGWLSFEDALYVASEWLYDSAARRYLK